MIFDPIRRFFADLRADFRNYDRENTDSAAVLSARFFSCFRGVFVQKLPIGRNAASFGVILLGSKVKTERVLLHEYGHRLQWNRLGFFRYVRRVALPSVTENLLDRMGKLPLPYYGSPWEREADELGKACALTAPWRNGAPTRFRELFPLLFRKKEKVFARFQAPPSPPKK